MENFITVEKKEQFSLIEVYPYLHFDNECKEDEEILFQESLDSRNFKVEIQTRSFEALGDISSWLEGYGFDNLSYGSNNTRIAAPSHRQYYIKGKSNAVDFLVYKEKLSVVVKFEAPRLSYFKSILKKFSDKMGYGNMWREGDHFVIK